MKPRTMTSAECAAIRELEAAEQDARDAARALEAARDYLGLVIRRERLRQRAKARSRVELCLLEEKGALGEEPAPRRVDRAMVGDLR